VRNNRLVRKSSLDELISMFIQSRYMSSASSYEVVRFDEAKEVYRQLTADYWNWIHDARCDDEYNKGYVTFLRDDTIGPPRQQGVKPPPYVKSIKIPEGSNVFFPVYHVHVCECDPHPDGGTCGGIDRCMEAAFDDLRKLNDEVYDKGMYAVEIKNDGQKPLTRDFKKHRVTLAPFTLKVPPNKLEREPAYHLNPGIYDGVVKGTYMYLKNFKKGKYVFHFGGEASNFETHSEYTIEVGV
jgi:hypothetical protein